MRRKAFVVSLVLLALFFLGACAGIRPAPVDPYATTAYGTLATAMSARDLMYGYVQGLRNSKLVTDEGWKAFDDLDTEFLKKYLEAGKAMSKYKRGLLNFNDAEAMMKLMNTALDKLKEYYINKIPADQMKPLF
jgi:hypothetical protein